MRRSTHGILIAVALLSLIVIASQSATLRPATAAQSTMQPTSAATVRATKPPPAMQRATAAPTIAPTVESTMDAADATLEATEVATDTGADTPVTFAKAPAPTAGSIGISLSPEDQSGVTLQSVTADGPADKAGLQAGDQITAIDGKTMSSRQNVVASIVAAKSGDTLSFSIIRDGKKQTIKVPVLSRREVYCPVAAPKLTTGASLSQAPFSASKNWTLDSGSTKGVKLVVAGDKLSFTSSDPSAPWAGLASLVGKPAGEFALSVDITQTGAAVGGMLLAYSKSGDYSFQLLPNGSWSMSAIVDGTPSPGGLSFSEPDLKAAADTTPNSSVTNTVGITIQGDNIYISFNGKFACGAPLLAFSDPTLDPGALALFGVVGKDSSGKSGVVFSNLTLNAVK